MPVDWEEKVAELEAEDPEAYDLLAFSSFLGTSSIPYEPYWYDQWAKRTGQSFEKWWYETPEALDEETRLSQCLDRLSDWSAVTYNPKGDRYHPFYHNRKGHCYYPDKTIRDAVNARLSGEPRHALANRVVEALYYSIGDLNYGWAYQDDFGRLDNIIEHAAICTEWFEEERVTSREAVWLLVFIGREIACQRRFAECEEYFRRALAIAEDIVSFTGAQDWLIADACGSYADFLEVFGKYTEAEPLRRRALDIHERLRQAGGRNSGSPEIFRGRLGRNLHHQGRHAEALPHLERYVQYSGEGGLNQSFRFAQDSRALADCLRAAGRTAEAENLEQRAQAITDKIQRGQAEYQRRTAAAEGSADTA